MAVNRYVAGTAAHPDPTHQASPVTTPNDAISPIPPNAPDLDRSAQATHPSTRHVPPNANPAWCENRDRVG